MFKDQKHANKIQKELQKCTTIKEIFDTVEKEFSISDKELSSETKGFVIHKVVMIIQGVGTMEKVQLQDEEAIKLLEASEVVNEQEEEEEEEQD